MITDEKVRMLVEQHIQGSTSFLVDVVVVNGSQIDIKVDDDEGFSIQDCVKLSRYLREKLDFDIEDFSLQVSSPGLNEPFKVTRQYAKNMGRDLQVKTKAGKIEGTLTDVNETGITMANRTKERIEGRKAKEWIDHVHEIAFSEIVETKIVISFK
jgi:ribosome maturation factor RimP